MGPSSSGSSPLVTWIKICVINTYLRRGEYFAWDPLFKRGKKKEKNISGKGKKLRILKTFLGNKPEKYVEGERKQNKIKSTKIIFPFFTPP